MKFQAMHVLELIFVPSLYIGCTMLICFCMLNVVAEKVTMTLRMQLLN